MTTQQQILDFYSRPTAMTSAGKHAARFDELPNDVGELTRIIQGLGLYEYVPFDFYGFTVPDKRKSETYLRPIERMLDRLLTIDEQPLSIARPVDKRLIGICHHFALLLVAMLRAKGIPARYRCGFLPILFLETMGMRFQSWQAIAFLQIWKTNLVTSRESD